MRETDFIRQNKEKWLELEELLKEERKDPDKLSNLFIQVTDDLSYSRTFYPNRSVRLYLNNIAQQLFYSIYKNRKEHSRHFILFWKEELPQLIFEARRDLLFSFVVFLIAVLIGIVSSANDAHFPRVILGDEYVKMTIENIKKGDPMAVYKKANGLDMFLGITMNNLLVAFKTFVLGAFFVIGTLAMLIYNGIMIGVFQYFFYEKGLFLPSFLSIWLHGTLEISSLIIGAGAGITMGKGLLFPGTYTRMQSFLISARRGFKILIGIVPILLLAAIIESFMTRYTDVPAMAKGSIIVLSLVFILGYFIWYPLMKSRKGFTIPLKTIRLPATPDHTIDLQSIKSNGEIFREIFVFYKKNFGKMFRALFFVAAIATICAGMMHYLSDAFHFKYRDWFFTFQLFDYDRIPLLYLINSLALSINAVIVMRLLKKHLSPDVLKRGSVFLRTVSVTLKISFIALLFNAIFFLNIFLAILVAGLLAPFFILWTFITYYQGKDLLGSFTKAFNVLNVSPGKAFGLLVMLGLIACIYFFMIDSPLIYLFFEMINWNLSFETETVRQIVFMSILFTSFFGIQLVFPIVLTGNSMIYFSLVEIEEANQLHEKIDRMIDKQHA